MKTFFTIVSLACAAISFAQKDSSVISNRASAQSELVKYVCEHLNLKMEECYLPFISEKVMPADSTKSIVVIPKIAETDYLAFDSYILIVDNRTSKIISTYFERAPKNNWISEPIRILSIRIDTAPYVLNSTTRAFGIRVCYEGPSRVGPYYEETISLFIQREEKIIQVLRNYSLVLSNGDWDGSCAGNFWHHEKILIISKQSTKGFANITVKDKITNRITTYQNNDCIEKEIHSSETEMLKYDGEMYKAAL